MKEKKLYKIAFMGDKDHGCDIISTLESWGGSNYYLRNGNDPEYVYFVNALGMIDIIHNSKMLSKGMENFYFMFWHDYNIECHLKVGESINYGGQDYDVDGIMFDANNRCIVYKLKSFGIGVEYITNNELTPTEEYQTEEENNMKIKLAFKGHATRGEEVIEILKMMGGKNNCDSLADNLGLCYLIDDEFDICGHYFGYDDYEDGKLNIFTLEEFLEKYPFKVGDKVFDIADGDPGTIVDMKWDEDVSDMKYRIAFDNGDMGWFTIDTFGFLKKDKNLELEKTTVKKHKMDPKSKSPSKYYEDKLEEMQPKRDIDETISMIGPVIVPDKVDDKWEYKIPNGFEFYVVVDGKIILKPIKPKYPKTYKGCCDVLLIPPYYNLRYHTYEPNYDEYATSKTLLSLEDKLNIVGKLLICRNAYWKIAGEQMGLDGPWEPDWKNSEEKRYCIVNIGGDISLPEKVLTKWILKVTNKILVFPTEEMRDAFYENFKYLIEQCKELL